MKLQYARLVRMTLAAAALAAGLSACVPVAVVGGAAAGGMVVTDRRSPRTQLADQRIEMDSLNAVWKLLGEGQRGHVNITSYYRKVLITGEVPTEQDKQDVQAAVLKAGGDVTGVVNELLVGPNSTLVRRTSDSSITTRVKTSLVHTDGVPANSIKVVTERGTVYLMGRLTERETLLATDVVSSAKGVERVVRIIDFISAQAALHPDDPDASTPAAPARAPVSDPAPAPAETGAVSHPVTQPAIEQKPPIQVQPLPPLKQ
ncbi:MAG: BON domain-containing protein [Burkholderiaceae bacterium]|jgi:osmotically-inducible protein OsmY|nr:BON domain-containing protein [Burkholderiaceae bacterium]